MKTFLTLMVAAISISSIANAGVESTLVKIGYLDKAAEKVLLKEVNTLKGIANETDVLGGVISAGRSAARQPYKDFRSSTIIDVTFTDNTRFAATIVAPGPNVAKRVGRAHVQSNLEIELQGMSDSTIVQFRQFVQSNQWLSSLIEEKTLTGKIVKDQIKDDRFILTIKLTNKGNDIQNLNAKAASEFINQAMYVALKNEGKIAPVLSRKAINAPKGSN